MATKAIIAVLQVNAADVDTANSPGNFSIQVIYAGLEADQPRTQEITVENVWGQASDKAISTAIKEAVKANLIAAGYVFGPGDDVRIGNWS